MALLPDILRAAGSPEGAAALRNDPVLNHNFLVSLIDTSSNLGAAVALTAFSAITDTLLGGFTECSGLDMSLAVEDYKEGGNNGTVLKFPGRVSWEKLTLKRGVTTATALWDWQNSFVVGKGKRKDGIIALLNELHVPNNIWFFRRGLPLKYTGPSMNATQNTVAIEILEIAHEGIFQVPFVGLASGVADAIATGLATGISATGGVINAGASIPGAGLNL